MYVISKKKMIRIILIVLLSLIILFGIRRAHIPKNATETSVAPNDYKTVILDAGHGYPDEGAVGNSGITEAGINLKITFKVRKLLEEKGINVILTRENENGIYNESCSTIKEMKKSDLKNRVKIGNESNADIFVSIHLNKIDQKQYWGWQTFFQKGNQESIKLATNIQDGISSVIEKDNKRVPLKIENIYIMENVKIPSTIVECGFLSNPEEEGILNTDEYQDKIASGICAGILKYFEEKI